MTLEQRMNRVAKNVLKLKEQFEEIFVSRNIAIGDCCELEAKYGIQLVDEAKMCIGKSVRKLNDFTKRYGRRLQLVDDKDEPIWLYQMTTWYNEKYAIYKYKVTTK